jgi:hypothetical protein
MWQKTSWDTTIYFLSHSTPLSNAVWRKFCRTSSKSESSFIPGLSVWVDIITSLCYVAETMAYLFASINSSAYFNPEVIQIKNTLREHKSILNLKTKNPTM